MYIRNPNPDRTWEAYLEDALSTEALQYVEQYVKDKKFRDFLISNLSKSNIETRISFHPLSKQPFIKKNDKIKKINLKNSEKAVDKLINLPIFADMTDSQQKYICNQIYKISKNYYK